MGSPLRTNNPLRYAEVDGIVIDERAPAGNVKGVGTGVAIMVAQLQRGLHGLTRVSSIIDFHQRYGKSSYSGNIQLRNKAFATLKIVRVEPTDSAKASLTVEDGSSNDIVTFSAKSKDWNKELQIDKVNISGNGQDFDLKLDENGVFEVYD